LALVSSLHLERPDLGLHPILSLRNLPLQCQELVPSRVRLSLRRPYGRQCTLDTFCERRRELLRRCGVAGVLPLLPEVTELGQRRIELRYQSSQCALPGLEPLLPGAPLIFDAEQKT